MENQKASREARLIVASTNVQVALVDLVNEAGAAAVAGEMKKAAAALRREAASIGDARARMRLENDCILAGRAADALEAASPKGLERLAAAGQLKKAELAKTRLLRDYPELQKDQVLS